MRDKLTPKQEAFARAVAGGMTQADAYRKAYNAGQMSKATTYKRASELMANGVISGRVEALQEKLAGKVVYGLVQAMDEADRAYAVAENKGNAASMVMAATLRAKLNGLLVERREVLMTQVQSLDDESLDALIALKTKEAGLHAQAIAVETGAQVH